MPKHLTTAIHQPPARVRGEGAPSPRAALALAKSQAYQDAADAPATLRAYATDLANFRAWCTQHGFVAMPATPEVIGAYLAAAGEGYALPTLRRRVAAGSPRSCVPAASTATRSTPCTRLSARRSAASAASTAPPPAAPPR